MPHPAQIEGREVSAEVRLLVSIKATKTQLEAIRSALRVDYPEVEWTDRNLHEAMVHDWVLCGAYSEFIAGFRAEAC